MTLHDFKSLTVDRFLGSKSRKRLWFKFECLYQEILVAGFPCEILVDGSYLTEEEEPSDIDFTIHVDVSLMNQASPTMRDILDRFDDGAEPGELDGFVCTTYPRGHEWFGTELDQSAGWAEQWAVSRSSWLKGIAVLRPGENDVGYRIYS